MTTLAAKIIADRQQYATSTAHVSAQRIADDYLALTAIVKAYVEGKTSVREVEAALTARDHLSRFFVTTVPMSGQREDQMQVLDFAICP